LAIGLALHLESGLPRPDAVTLAASVDRGMRSALGIHGFSEGGFLVEGGKNDVAGISPLICRHTFPEDWPIILVLGRGDTGRHGSEEKRIFEQLSEAPPSVATTEALCRLVLLGLLPTLIERDFAAFAEALHDFNARAGELFQCVQQGIYSSARAGEVIAWLRREGVACAGQSSWGPTVFGIFDDADRANVVVPRIRDAFQLMPDEVVLTRASNEGARVTKG
jgi:beta-RFAP synthase